jgi:hypothetical protein
MPLDTLGTHSVISRDELEQVLVPWFGRRYEHWLRHQVRPDPTDPLVVRIPNDLYDEYRRRPKMTPLTREQKRRLGVH